MSNHTARELLDWADAHVARITDELTDHELALLAAQGFAKLWRDINSQETLLDVAERRLEREAIDAIIEGPSVSLPGWERGRDWFENCVRNGSTDPDLS